MNFNLNQKLSFHTIATVDEKIHERVSNRKTLYSFNLSRKEFLRKRTDLKTILQTEFEFIIAEIGG